MLFTGLMKKTYWVNIYAVIITLAYIIWRAVVFTTKL